MLEFDNSYDELSQTEKKLYILINSNKKAWAEIYKLLDIIDQKKLWIASNNSFSGWLKSFAKRTKTNESVLWHNRQAGKFYESFVNRAKSKFPKISVPELSEVKISSENLNLIEKISGKNILMADLMITKLINKETNQKELRALWNTVKSEKLAKGEEPTTINGYTKKKESTLITLNEMLKEIHEISINDIALILTSKSWLPKELIIENTKEDKQFKDYENTPKYFYLTEFPIKYIDRLYRLNFIIAENYTIPAYDRPIKLNFHSIIIITNHRDLNEILEMIKITPIYTDYSWLIIPENINQQLNEKIPKEFGIIKIKETTKEAIIEKIPIKSSAEDIKTYKMQVLSTFIIKK